MAMINNVFVNIGVSGSHESAEGVGSVSISGVRNFLRHPWPQVDMIGIDFYNPLSSLPTPDMEKNRRLTRKQTYWMAYKLSSYLNSLVVPDDGDIKGDTGELINGEVLEPTETVTIEKLRNLLRKSRQLVGIAATSGFTDSEALDNLFTHNTTIKEQYFCFKMVILAY